MVFDLACVSEVGLRMGSWSTFMSQVKVDAMDFSEKWDNLYEVSS